MRPAPVSLAPVSLAPVSLAPVSLAAVSLAPVSLAPVSLALVLGACAVLAACAPTRNELRPLATAPASLRAAFERMPAPASGDVTLLADNTDAWVERWRLIESARHTIDVTYFIVGDDAFGLSFLGLLYEKQKSGVDVRLMVDSRGTPLLSRAFAGAHLLGELAGAGAEVRIYNRLEARLPDSVVAIDLRKAVASNHDKLILVDEQASILGGRNITRDYFNDPRDQPTAYIDMDVLVSGRSTATALKRAFDAELKADAATSVKVKRSDDDRDTLLLSAAAMRAWLKAPALGDDAVKALVNSSEKREALALELEGALVAANDHIPGANARGVLREVARVLAASPRLRGALARPRPALTAGAEGVRVLDTISAAEDARGRITENMQAAIQAAEHHVMLESPYLLLSERGITALEQAARRGVRVTILTNSPTSTDNGVTQAAFLKQWPLILGRVPTARLFVVGVERLMHAKVVTIDDTLAFVGSYNLDPLSAAVNGEVMVAVWSKPLATALHDLVQQRIARAAPSIYEYTIELERDEDSRVVVKFGPEHHCDKDALTKVRSLNSVIGLLAPII